MLYERKITGLKPLSVNRAWRGQRFKTREYADFREEMGYLLGKKRTIDKEQLEVRIRVGLEKGQYARSDIDNFLKPILDSLVDVGIIADDRYITRLSIEKYLAEEPTIEIAIL